MSLLRSDIVFSPARTARRLRARSAGPAQVMMQALEDRRMLSGLPSLPGDTITRDTTETVAGFEIDYTEHNTGGHPWATLWIYGPDTSDQIKVSRNTSLPKAMDFDFNGTFHT